MKIAIVGFGVSGAALLMALKTTGKLDKNDVTVDIFDPREEFAVGPAYQKDTKYLLLNAFPTAMSLKNDEPMDFPNWLEEHYPEYESTVDLVPRTIYGEYAKERIEPLLELDNVNYINQEVIDIDVRAEQNGLLYQLEDAQGELYDDYDYLFLAVGVPDYQDFYNLRGTENYVHNPYPVIEKLKDLDEDKHIAIIGSGLTAFDIVNYLSHEKKLTQPIGVFTNRPDFNSLRVSPYRGPALTYSLDKEWIDNELRTHKGYIPLERIVETVQADLIENNIDLNAIRAKYDPADLDKTYQTYFGQEHPDLSKVQAYIAKLSPNLGDLYMSLTKGDVVRFRLDYAPLFSHYQVRLAPDAVENMYHLTTEDKLFVVPDLVEIDKEDRFILKSLSGETFEADIVINATGFAYNTDLITSEDNALLRKLLDKGFLLDKEKRGILVTWPETKVMNQTFGKLDNCFYIGPWLTNTHFGNNNVKALVRKANEIVVNYMG